MSDDELPPGALPSIEAAEYVLGLLEPAEHAQARARLRTDAEFAREVAWWQRRFAPLSEECEEAPPPPGLWPRIEAALGAGSGGVVTPANDTGGRVAPFWRPYGLGMTAVAAGLAVALLVLPRETVVPPPVIVQPEPEPGAPVRPAVQTAQVAPEQGVPVAVITYLPDSGELVVAPLSIAAGAEQVPELWFIPGDGTPRSLGVIPAAGGARVTLPAGFGEQDTLAISIEPAGGSPTGAPTGPIVGTGTLSPI